MAAHTIEAVLVSHEAVPCRQKKGAPDPLERIATALEGILGMVSAAFARDIEVSAKREADEIRRMGRVEE